ncbi:MAG: thermonuclease family protein [Bacilli bacterium]
MNKHKIIILSLLSLFIFSSCENSNDDINFIENSPLLFSEFIKGETSYDRLIEIYNKSDEDISLDDYRIVIYKQNEKEEHISIPLSGTINSHDTFVICHTEANDMYHSYADYFTSSLMVDGTWPVALKKGNDLVDVLGIIGYQFDYAKHCDLVRKKEYMVNRKSFESYDWVKYYASNLSTIGNVDAVISEEELLEGPKLTSDDFLLPFINEDGLGGGGVVEVGLSSLGDGDTTTFTFPSSVVGEYINRSESVRYLGINTPEIQHGTYIDAQPWGNKAKEYNNNILRNAKHYLIQTCLNSSIRETYGRFLGFVWYTNVDNPNPGDYTLLNFEMVKEAYAFQLWMLSDSSLDPMSYLGVPYMSIFNNAEMKAKNEGKKIHGEVDPEFDY